MKNYKEIFNNIPMTCKKIIDVCTAIYPENVRPYAYPGINHGEGILKTEEQMNCYTAAYGEIHLGKCGEAFRNFPVSQLTEDVEIMDWGCGQGIASLRAFEILKRKNPAVSVKRVTLIDASVASVDRAVFNWSKMSDNSVEIVPIVKDLSVGKISFNNEISRQYPIIIHIFSNILDIEYIDLEKMQKKVSTLGGKQFIMCMGPMNDGSGRIDAFCRGFSQGKYFSNVENSRYRQFPNSSRYYSCKTKCFSLFDATDNSTEKFGCTLSDLNDWKQIFVA